MFDDNFLRERCKTVGGPERAAGRRHYLSLRAAGIGESVAVNDLTIRRDVGLFQLQSGRVSFVEPVLDRVTMAVFTGRGRFILEPQLKNEVRNLVLLTGESSVSEPFDELVVWFTDDTEKEIRDKGEPVAPDARAAEVLRRFRSRMRSRRKEPRSVLEAMLTGEDMENVEADILARLYNPQLPPFFNAMIYGKKHDRLRFQIRPEGVLPGMQAAEEVALIHLAPGQDKEGIWYLAHREDEYRKPVRETLESKQRVDATHYRIDTQIAGNRDVSGTCEMSFTARAGGDRVLKLGLLPTLRVSQVSSGNGAPVPFIQEPKDEDASLYVVLTEALTKGSEYKVTIAYAGDKVIEDAGGGNYAVGARSSWYPNVNTFNDVATFELTFEYPKKTTLVSVGQRIDEQRKGNVARSHWKSDVPLKVAGFNYGRYKQQTAKEESTGYEIEAYATSTVPDFLRRGADLPGENTGMPTAQMTPSKMLKKAVAETNASILLFSRWFGKPPYGRIAITQQPQFGFGQSWPTLVYLPVSAFLDSTQRWLLLGAGTFRFAEFIQEITPHEVAHQWWGHMVGWSSYHDQWLSEGFSDFSASVFVQAVNKNPDPYLQFLKRWREAILDKNEFGFRANDVGPIWMGRRLRTAKTSRAYSKLVYAKGGFVVHMLRRLMFHHKTGDEGFVKMMHDFVESHLHKNASTESFQRTVEKHMTPTMNLDGNGKMDWFFNQWVYGTEVPSYRFDYSVAPQSDGGVLLKGTLTQSGVSDGFKTQVPVYLHIGQRVTRLGQMPVKGNNVSQEMQVKLPHKPDRVSINHYYDVLADEVVINSQ